MAITGCYRDDAEQTHNRLLARNGRSDREGLETRKHMLYHRQSVPASGSGPMVKYRPDRDRLYSVTPGSFAGDHRSGFIGGNGREHRRIGADTHRPATLDEISAWALPEEYVLLHRYRLSFQACCWISIRSAVGCLSGQYLIQGARCPGRSDITFYRERKYE